MSICFATARRVWRLFPSTLFAAALLLLLGRAAAKPPQTTQPGPVEGGFRLPNGWTITPAGAHLPLTDLPLNIAALSDGRHALVSTNGFNAHELSLVDLAERRIVSKVTQRQSWFGLAVAPHEDRVWWSGGGGKDIHALTLSKTELSKTDGPSLDFTSAGGDNPTAANQFKSGLGLSSDGSRLYSLDIEAGTIAAIDVAQNKVVATGVLGGRPYDVAVGRRTKMIYVSDWAGRAVLVVRPDDLRVVDRIGVGEHPNQVAHHPHDERLFVACASTNNVAVIDTRRGIVTETITTSLFPRAPEGSTPDALCVAPDGKKLYVANADNNCVAVVDIEQRDRSAVLGFIPTGWYPTALTVSRDGTTLLVGNGRGNGTAANPIDKQPGDAAQRALAAGGRVLPFPYIGTTMAGTLSLIAVPDDEQLAQYTRQVFGNCPYSDELLSNAPTDQRTVIPTRVGDSCEIKHVIYIIKENRTYDQVLGDLPIGNGDKSLVMFGADVTPNHHKLAAEFVILDNLYCDGQVSRDGHPWSTQAYNTDYTARDWTLTYSGREGIDDDDELNLANAPSGYIWDACDRASLTFRSYGEYGKRVSQSDGSVRMEAGVPGLAGHVCPAYGVPRDPSRPHRDTDNVEIFLEEFREFERHGNLPNFIVMSLGEDHTKGTRPGEPTPAACVASNDLALGRLVEAVTKSKYWPRTAIFVIEDDAQNGPDHVDARRTVGLVISPYVKRRHLDSTQYTTCSMLRTMELILGLPPLSQFDAAATPMFGSFTDQADLTPYEHESARIDLEARNEATAYGAERSLKMDFSEYDRIDDFELNEILWFAIKGPQAPQPAVVRRAIAYRAPRDLSAAEDR